MPHLIDYYYFCVINEHIRLGTLELKNGKMLIIYCTVCSDCVRIFQGARFALHLSILCATLDLRCAFYCITLLRNLSMDAQITHLYQ